MVAEDANTDVREAISAPSKIEEDRAQASRAVNSESEQSTNHIRGRYAIVALFGCMRFNTSIFLYFLSKLRLY